MLTIRRAEIKDIPVIMKFLDDHWLQGFALAHDRTFFDWQFVHNGKVNIWIGIDDETGKLYAIQCMIIYRYIDNPDVSGSTWLAIKSPNPLLAFDVQNSAWDELLPRAYPTPGLRPDAIKAFKLLGYPLITMDHYYRLADLAEYRIAVIKDKVIPSVPDTGYSIIPCNTIKEFAEVISEEELIESVPSKDHNYIQWRYFEHPIFKYDLWKILDKTEQPKGILVTRDEYANDSVACKIVDFYGKSNLLGKITHALDELIVQRHYEFIDIYSYGVSADIYENNGWIKCDTQSANIITNFFQPYTPENSDICMVEPNYPGARLFRGDGDQDKPRLYSPS